MTGEPPRTRKMPGKTEARLTLVSLLDEARAAGKRIVFTNGCYDLLHVGHVRLLQAARDMGDILVVGLNSDASVRRLKGPDRPLQPALERAEIMAALACVDYVTFFDEDTPSETLSLLRPHVHVKGGDYVPERLPEYEAVRKIGAEIRIVPLVEGKSTSRLVERMSRG